MAAPMGSLPIASGFGARAESRRPLGLAVVAFHPRQKNGGYFNPP